MVKWTESIGEDVVDRARAMLAQHGMADAAITVVPGIVGASLGPALRQGFAPAVFLAISIAKETP